jgi:hypothetical protein
MPRGLKVRNEYIEMLGGRHFTHTPKSVLAAIAMSFAMRLAGDNQDEARALFFDEWNTLAENGIVPQKCFVGRKSKP